MKRAVSLALAGVMAFSLVGCGGAKKDDKKQSLEKVTLKVVTTFAGEDGNRQNFVDAVAAWEKKSGNKVEDGSATSDEAFKEKVITDFSAGSEPDVLFFFNGTDATPFIETNKVVSIDEIRKQYPEYASNMDDAKLGASPYDGKNYSVPVNGFWEAMFVNKDVLKDCGVEVPTADTTWEEFIDICQKIKDKGYTPIAASLAHVPHYWFEYTIFNHTSPSTHLTIPTSKDDTNGKAWAAGLDDIKDLYEKGFFPEDTLTAKDEETFAYFTGDKAAFLIDGSWKVGGIQQAVEDIENFTVTYVPGMGGERQAANIIGGISMGYYITRKAWDDPLKRAAAVDFVMSMTSSENVIKFAGVGATALKEAPAVDESAYDALQRDAMAMVAGSAGSATGAVQDFIPEAARKPIFQEMAAIVKGEKTSADAVQQVLDLLAEDAE